MEHRRPISERKEACFRASQEFLDYHRSSRFPESAGEHVRDGVLCFRLAHGDDYALACRQAVRLDNYGQGKIHQGRRRLRFALRAHITGRRYARLAAQILGETLRTFQLCCLLRSEEHTSELQSLMRLSYAVFCLNK